MISPIHIRARLAPLSLTLLLYAAALASASESNTRVVGPQSDGSYVVADNQRISPAGKLVELGSPVRAKAVAINPNSATRTAAVLLMGASEPIVIFNTLTGEILQRYTPPANSAGSFAGIAYAASGSRMLFSQDNNYVSVARVDANGLLSPEVSIAIPPPDNPQLFTPGIADPGGVAVAEGGIGLVAISASNTLGILDIEAGVLRREVPVGNAPNHVVVKGNLAYVSNEGGRPATSMDFTNLSDGTPIVVDRMDAAATSGTISVIDIQATRLVASIDVGLHPAGMVLDGSTLYVANSFDDTVSVIDTLQQKVVRTIKVGVPVKGGAFGAGVNDIVVVGSTGYVTLGQSNAIAVVDLARGGSGADEGAVQGYIPTGYFPTSIAYDPAQHALIVADDKGIGTRGVRSRHGVSGYSTHQDSGVVNIIPVPSAEALRRLTATVVSNNHWNSPQVHISREHSNPAAAPVAIPAHIGEPSLIKHVFLVIKENRTYDQMLGDLPQGNGDAALAVFGGNVPNQKALVQRFPLLDNVYAPSRQSADGHPWIVESGSFYSNDIQSPDWLRSYPGGNSNDALTYTQQGFLWSQARKRGLAVKMYGEWSGEQNISGSYTWADFYNTALYKESGGARGRLVVPDGSVTETTSVPSAAAILDPHYPSFNTGIPDQYRVDVYLPQFAQQLAEGTVPELTILWLPDDHTSGFTTGFPVPASAQADNDLALGRIVDAISHSNVWGSSAIFVEEDDAQDGVDHVDGHRQPVYVISPYAAAPQAPKVGKVIHTIYTAENINRTIENILGFMPLTQFDLTVAPMFDCFQNTPDLTPFSAVPANTPLNLDPHGPIAGTATATAVARPAASSVASASVRLQPKMAQAWLRASNKVMRGRLNKADSVDENFLNHVIWYASTGWRRPYPGESEVKPPDAFVKAALRSRPEDDD